MRILAFLFFCLTIPLLYVDGSGVVGVLPLAAAVPIFSLLAIAKAFEAGTLALLLVQIVLYGGLLWLLATKLVLWVSRMPVPLRNVGVIVLVVIPIVATLLPLYFVAGDGRGPYSALALYAWAVLHVSML